MRILAIDFGLKRVGLAISDPAGTMAFPLATITRTTRQALFQEITAVLAREGVELIVVGRPSPAPGRVSQTAVQAENFAQSLLRRTSLPVVLVDETLSSEAAMDDLIAAGVKPGKRKQILDQQAAARILETYLQAPEQFS